MRTIAAIFLTVIGLTGWVVLIIWRLAYEAHLTEAQFFLAHWEIIIGLAAALIGAHILIED